MGIFQCHVSFQGTGGESDFSSSNLSVTEVKFIDEMLTEQLGSTDTLRTFVHTPVSASSRRRHTISKMQTLQKNRGTLTSTSGMRNRSRMLLKTVSATLMPVEIE